MNDLRPAYYSVIPADVRYDESLSSSEKLFYSEITALSGKYGFCFASNAYFAKLYGVSVRTVIRWVKKLERCGYIKTEFICNENDNETEKRKIYITSPLWGGGEDIKRGYSNVDNSCTNVDKSGQKCHTPHDKNVRAPRDKNVTYNNTRSNNTSLIYSRAAVNEENATPLVEKVIGYLNKKANKNFKSTSKHSRELIKQRHDEGFSFKDFKTVIDNKTNHWLGGEFEDFLRPSTLFGDRFEEYLHQKAWKPRAKNKKRAYSTRDRDKQYTSYSERARQERFKRLLEEKEEFYE